MARTVISVSVTGAEPLKLRDLVDGVIPNGTTAELSDNNSYDEIRSSVDLYAAIDADNAVLVINGTPQNKAESLAYMQDLGTGGGPGTDPTPALTEDTNNVNSTKPIVAPRFIETAPAQHGQITSLSIQGQSTSVNTGFTLTGNQTFNFSVNNPSLFTGTLTLSQGATVLSSTIAPTATSVSVAVTETTLNAVGENIVFTLSGTNTDGQTVSRTFTIHVAGSSELVYFGLSSTNNPSSVDLTTLQSHIVGTGELTISTGATTAGQFYIILVPSDHDIHSIIDINNQNVTDLFTKTNNVRTIASTSYISYVIGPLNADAEGETYVLNLI